MNNPEYLTLQEVSNELKIPLPLLMQLIRHYDFPSAMIDGRRRASREALEEWQNNHEELLGNIVST